MSDLVCNACGSVEFSIRGRLGTCEHCGLRYIINPDELEHLVPINGGEVEIVIPHSIFVGRFLNENGYPASTDWGSWDPPLENFDRLYIGSRKEETYEEKRFLRESLTKTKSWIEDCLQLHFKRDPWIMFVWGSEYVDYAKKVAELIQYELGYPIKIVLQKT